VTGLTAPDLEQFARTEFARCGASHDRRRRGKTFPRMTETLGSENVEKEMGDPMATTISNGNDVMSFLKMQHKQIKKMLERVTSCRGKERASAFVELRRMLAIHEAAEEEIVHPAAKRALPDGKSLVEMRLREENDAKKTLTKLEKLDVDSTEFENGFRVLKGSVLSHAESEEHEEFNRLASKLEPDKLQRMRKAVELAESVAPTRPHAGLESAAANMLVGPFAAMVDRVRDAISGKGSEA
jgi:hemerythrin superfamily protein